MKIEISRNRGYELIFEADNVRIVEDIESREYPKDEDGKTIFNFAPKRDILTNALEQIAFILDDMIYYRQAEFDSSNLIKSLFEKLPHSVATKLVERLKHDYEKEEYEMIVELSNAWTNRKISI